MSTLAPDPTLEPLGTAGGAAPGGDRRGGGGAAVPAVAFGGLALYGALRWGILLTPSPTPRLLGLAGLAVLVALGGRAIAGRPRWLVAVLALVAIPVLLALAGVPVAWLVHARIAVIGRWVGDGVSALPAVLLPYEQADEWVRVAITGGAGVLLALAGLIMAAGRPTPGWRAAAALPLLVLGLTPSVLIRPAAPTLHGLLLLALLCGLVWGDRVPRDGLPAALGLAGTASLAALAVAPAVDPHHPWLDVQALASRLAPKAPEQFTFDQSYGPLHWPSGGRQVFEVRAPRADYWKVEDLSAFDGRGFVAGTAAAVGSLPAPDPAQRARFTQPITVTIRGLSTPDVIAAGESTPPSHLSRNVSPGLNAGTWVLSAPLGPGDSYTTTTYSPEPSATELERAGSGYPESELVSYRSVLLPSGAPGTVQPLLVPPFHSSTLAAGVLSGPYAPVFTLAQRLERSSATPYDFVARVMAYLGRGFVYDQNPPPSSYPLVSFLFKDKLGYCQQFSGAMALLLRLGGLPARVAGGFTPGVRDTASGRWIVSDLDAHDWVEVWFPHYGWVRFDPTPAVAPARATSASVPDLGATPRSLGVPRVKPQRHRELLTPAGARAVRAPGRAIRPGGGFPAWAVVLILVLCAGALLVALALRRPPPDSEALVAELDRALRRCRRPVRPGETLVAVEHRLRHHELAAGYVRALRAQRYGAANGAPVSAEGRRALRNALRRGRGPAGRLIALWVLPPRRL